LPGLFLFCPKAGDFMKKEKSALQLVEQCRSEGDISDQRLEWEYVQEFRRKNHFVMIDRKQRRIVNLAVEGTKVPGTNYRVSGAINAPIDPHICTISNSIEAKTYANWPFLVPQVRAATAEDADRDAAKNSTMLLMYYRQQLDEEQLFRESLGYIMPCGNVYLKTYWDVNSGDFGTMDENGNAVKLGDVACKVNSPQKMLIPKGIPNDKDLPWIGEENALPVDQIGDAWGIEVQPEDNLEKLNTLQPLDYAGFQNKTKQLKDHAKVTEIYFKPTKEYPLGRLIIACSKKILYDGVWDKKLTSQYPDEWNPYNRIQWINIQGDYWAKSLLCYLTDHQIQLNRLYKKLIQSKKYSRGWWSYREGSIDWKRVNFDSDDGTPRIPYRSEPAQFVNAPIQNTDIPSEMAQIRQYMNDIAANYEVSRGNAPSNVTSGKQVTQLQAANNIQLSPLLSSFANTQIGHWRKILRLCAVHYESQGRLIRIVGENNETIAKNFTPDEIKSDDIILATGQSFFMAPEDRLNELDRWFQTEMASSPQNAMAIKKKYYDLRGIGGGLEELYADYTNDVTMAKWENDEFEQGNFYEQDQVMINDCLTNSMPFTPELQQWKTAHDAWLGMQNQENTALQAMDQGVEPVEKLQGLPPPAEVPPEPQPPPIYRLARSYEDHTIHIDVLNNLRKTHKYEMLCLQNPEYRKALDFHYRSHLSYLNPPAPVMPMAQPTQQGNVSNISQSPPSGNSGENPASLGINQMMG
jgi:hypothetical protein